MDCQLNEIPDHTENRSRLEQHIVQFVQVTLYWAKRLKKAITKPSLMFEKIQSRPDAHQSSPRTAALPSKPAPLNLRPGDKVRIRSLDEIRATLDESGRFEGLAFIYSEMAKHCGNTYRVHKPIKHFFDERTRRFLKPRNVVTLSQVFCEPAWDSGHDYAGCDRSCFLFWKEAWLERVMDE